MKDIVTQLVTLVGGASTAGRRTGRGRCPNVRAHRGFTNTGLGKSDETFHTIAHKSGKGSNSSKVSSRSSAEKVIPLSADEFDDFNA